MFDAEAEAPLWLPDVKSQLIGKDPDARKDWGQEEKGVTEDEMAGWHHQLNGHELLQALGDGEGQVSLACCSPWVCKKLDETKWLNNNSASLEWWSKSDDGDAPSGREIMGNDVLCWLWGPAGITCEREQGY